MSLTLSRALLCIAAAALGSCAAPMLPQPIGEVDRSTVVELFLQGSLEAVEGVWIWPDGRYEVAILQNEYSSFQEYDLIGVVTDTKDKDWHRGEVKFLLKRTADPTLYVGDLVMNNKKTVSVTVHLVSTSLMKVVPQSSAYGLALSLVRTYPVTGHMAGSSRPSPGTGIRVSGTGFVICPQTVVTNQHVIDDAKSVRVYFQDGSEISASVALSDEVNDLAVLKLQAPSRLSTFPTIAETQTREGDRVYTIGYPMAGELGKRPRLGEGMISSVAGLGDDPRILHVTVPIHPGNSGGPLISDSGQIVGIVTSRLRDEYIIKRHGVVPQSVNFGVKSDYLTALLSMTVECDECERLPATSKLDASQIMDLMRSYVVYIEVQR